MTKLELKVLETLLKLPKGRIITYAGLAKKCKINNGARFIGNVMRKNPDPTKYPCYKVIKSNGEIGSYSAGEGRITKIHLLKKEGVKIQNGKIINFKNYL